MVAQEFISLIGKFKLSTYVGLEDFADKLNFLFSVVLLLLCIMVVTLKSYFFEPLVCYMSAAPGGSNFESYLKNYCWVQGTISILPGQKLPQTQHEWELANDKKITYYQWVPFILSLQCILFYVPRIVWQIICISKSGNNLEALVERAHAASNEHPESRDKIIKNIADSIEDMLWKHRDYRTGKLANWRRKLYNLCNLAVFSKHLGTWLLLFYIFVKCLYGLNVIGQLYLMKHFLGYHGPITSFGQEMLRNIANGRDWKKTGIFPRVTYCYLGTIRTMGSRNKFVAQCALPINMLNEKIYIFLWFWMFLVGVITIGSIPVWLFRMGLLGRRAAFIRKFLLMSDTYSQIEDKSQLTRFIREFLRHDGVFLVRMICINSGDLITSDLVQALWKIYTNRYKNKDLRECDNASPHSTQISTLNPDKEHYYMF